LATANTVWRVATLAGRIVKRAFASQGANMQMSDAMMDYLKMDKSHNAIRAIHARGSVRLPPDFLHKFESTDSADPTVNVIHKAHAAAGLAQVDMKRLAKSVRRYDFRKVSFPPQSRNAQWDNVHADTGASNNWNDEDTTGDTPKPSLVARTMPKDVSNSTNSSAAVNSYGVSWKTSFHAAAEAIKQDLKRPKRFGIDQ
jgi:hypothetical protein